jgi:hypothetical protein
MVSIILKTITLLTLVLTDMITHYTNKAWLVTWECIGPGMGCVSYGIHGIFNKENLAKDAAVHLKKNHNWREPQTFTIMVKEVSLDGTHELFNYVY